MYTPRAFQISDWAQHREIIERHPLATLVACAEAGLTAAHVPFLLTQAESSSPMLTAHVAVQNTEFSNLADDTPVLAIFQGPHGYVSPNWYPSKPATGGKAVPTWNYVALHVHGHLRVIRDADWLIDHLRDQTVRQESGQVHPWRLEDAPSDYLDTMLRHIVGLSISIDRVEAKAKLSQNRAIADHRGVIEALEAAPEQLDARRALAEAMRETLSQRQQQAES